MAKTEAKIRNLDEERIYAFDKNGKELGHSETGTYRNTALPKGNYKDSIMTHNHPNAWIKDKSNLAGRVGSSFSSADLIYAAIHDAREIRAVTKGGYTFSIKRPKDGWKINRENANTVKKMYNQQVKTHFNKYNDAYRKRGMQPIGSKYDRDFFERAYVNAFHQTMKDLSKLIGFNYTRKRTQN